MWSTALVTMFLAVDDAKTVTRTGCLRASNDGFDLTEITPNKSNDGREVRSQ
jgi:hypothetical protein